MSSCEAELVALADLAIELIYIRELAAFVGHVHDGIDGIAGLGFTWLD